jgi:tellurite resistance protein TerC
MEINTLLLYGIFTLFILAMLAIDLGIFNREAHVVKVREAVIWSIIWVALALIFNAGVWWYEGSTKALEFLTGYLIERALSFDNIFVFVIIFSYFAVPQRLHHRALFWGVLGALITRAIFIAAGTALITRFEWILYVFGAILVVSGWKMLRQKNVEVHPDRNLFIRLARTLFPVTQGYESGTFFSRVDGRFALTPLFLVLVTIETTDVVFAVDSIPAVFGVTQDPFIVYTSNIFAILGLRATYFLLAGVMDTFYYLSHALSAILIFIGLKMLVADFVHVPVLLSLLVVALMLAVSIIASIIHRRRARSGDARADTRKDPAP